MLSRAPEKSLYEGENHPSITSDSFLGHEAKTKDPAKRTILGTINESRVPPIKRSFLSDITNSAAKRPSKTLTPAAAKPLGMRPPSTDHQPANPSPLKRSWPPIDRGTTKYVASQLRHSINADDDEIDLCSTISTLDTKTPPFGEAELIAEIRKRIDADEDEIYSNGGGLSRREGPLSPMEIAKEWLSIQAQSREIAYDPMPLPLDEDCKFVSSPVICSLS